jgi:large subunit ribosomal protein L24
MRLKKGDTVIVLSGRDRGKKGKILSVLSRERKVTVERVNVVKRHQKPSRNFQGGIIEKVIPVYMSKVMLVCPRCSQPTRISSKRICRACGEIIDKV